MGSLPRHQFVLEETDSWHSLQSYAADCKLGLLVLGKGANLLVGDEPLDATVVSLMEGHIQSDGDGLILPAGASIQKGVHAAMENSLAGLSWAASIPGTWGGALKMNAGAYGGETGALVDWVEGISEDYQCFRLSGQDVAWSYRHSTWPVKVLAFTRLRLQLKRGDRQTILEEMQKLGKLRQGKFPKAPCAGSTFKNPPGMSAGQLIDSCGLKGFKIGGAEISMVHGNIFINKNGRSLDFIHLILQAQADVYRLRGIWLEPEVVLWDEKNWQQWRKILQLPDQSP